MTAPHPHPRRVALVATACSALFSVVLGACGGAVGSPVPDAGGQPVPAAAPAVDPATADEILTTVPPLNERYPELFNERGCAIGPDTPALSELPPEVQEAIKASLPPDARAQLDRTGEIDLDAMAPEVLGALLEAQGVDAIDCTVTGATPSDPSEFYGYSGPNAGRVQPGEVDAYTVVSEDGTWGATGYTSAPSAGGTVTIEATLTDVNGQRITTLATTSPVRGARAGEPIVFSMTSDIDAAKVASVAYAVSESAGEADRELSIMVEGVIADGDRAVVIGTVTNSSGDPIDNPAGVIAISDGAGRPTDLIEFTVNEPGTTRPIARLEPGYSGTFELAVDDPAHTLTTAAIEVWTFGS